LFFCFDDVRTNRKHAYRPPRSVSKIALLFICSDVRTSQETHLSTYTACYGDSFTSLYVDDVRTSQETHVLVSTVCYRDSFTFYM
jgi:hypothetical protein